MRLDLDMPVNCVDGVFGALVDVLVQPRARRLTHLVIQPHERQDHARLVPTDRAHAAAESDGISLDATIASIYQLEPIAEFAYLRPGEVVVEGDDWDVGIQDIIALPEYGGLGPQPFGSVMPAMDYDQHVAVSYHRVPKGEVELRRSSAVTSSDGHHLGHVVGFVIDDQQKIGQLVLEHGHLWGKRTVAIPSPSIERLQNDEVTLNLSSDQVGALEPLPR